MTKEEMESVPAPFFFVALRDNWQGFDMPDIETEKGNIVVLPAIGTEQQARIAIAELSRVSGVPKNLFRICRYEFKEVLEG